MDSVTEELSAVTVFPLASWTATVTAGLILAPAVALVGCCPNASFAAAPAVMLKALLAAL